MGTQLPDLRLQPEDTIKWAWCCLQDGIWPQILGPCPDGWHLGCRGQNDASVAWAKQHIEHFVTHDDCWSYYHFHYRPSRKVTT